MYNVSNLCWTILANLAVSDMQMQVCIVDQF